MNERSVLKQLGSPLLGLILAAVLLLAAAPVSQPTPTQSSDGQTVSSTITLPPGANVIKVRPPVDKRAYPKLESQLAQLYESAVLGRGRPLETFAGQDHIDLAAGKARVIIEMDLDPQAHKAGPSTFEQVTLPDGRTATIEHAAPTTVRADLAEAISATGATYELAVGDLVQVLAPFSSLEMLSQIVGVRVVRLPFPAQEQAVAPPQMPEVGAQSTEGINLTKANTWHAAGYDGTGVNLAVFDLGFTGWGALQASGDLPGSIIGKDFSTSYAFAPDTAGHNHGAACAEIAYDMAPGSTIYLYAWGTDAEFASAVDDYIDNVAGNRVATMSINWVNAGPYDGTSAANGPDDKVNDAAAAGIFWANSAGNYQKQHHSWTSEVYPFTGYEDYVQIGWLAIGPIGRAYGDFWTIPSGDTIEVYLEWNNWNDARTENLSHVDYDLYLLRYDAPTSNWIEVASSTGDQCGTSLPPTESIAFTATDAGTYAIMIKRDQGGGACANNYGHWMELFTSTCIWEDTYGARSSWWWGNECNSLAIPADADGVVAVGATFWSEDGNSSYDYGLETFSSLGPRNASGGANPGTTVDPNPDVVAPDGVSTAAYGASNGTPYRTSGFAGFFGTSAAAPHVAGLAATVWERHPGYSLADLRGFVETNAVTKGDGGVCGGATDPNNRYGQGRIDLPANPTFVRLARFEGWPERAAIHVEWETVTEIDTLGFNLYRADAADGPYTKLNEELIPSQAPGSPVGAVYVWLDNRVQAGRTYYYKLEDVDIYGNTTMYGPVQVKAGPRLRLRP